MIEYNNHTNIQALNESIQMKKNSDGEFFAKSKKQNVADAEASSVSQIRFRDAPTPLDKIFMEMAHLVSRYSNDPKCKVGAIVVSEDDEIVSFGYNRMPRVVDKQGKTIMDNDKNSEYWKDKEVKLKYVCHAELNAIVNKNRKSIKNGKIYVTLAPCDDCFKIIVKSGIKEINYNLNLPKWHVKEYMKKIIRIKQMPDISTIRDRRLGNYEPDWDNFFIRVAYLYSRRCQDTEKGNGACIVDSDNKIVGVGYSDNTHIEGHKVEYCAELNAYINSQQGCIENGKIYVTSYPCRDCAKLITQCGIIKLYYLGERTSDKDTQKMFEDADVEVCCLHGVN